MVEIEELPEDSKEPVSVAKTKNTQATGSSSASEEEKLPPPPPGYKYRKTKKELPSVAHLLAHGSPESQGRPKTFCDIFGYPIFVAICFAISLIIFHYAPHDKSVQPKGKFARQFQMHQQQQRQRQLQQQRQMMMDQHPEQHAATTGGGENTGAAEGEL